MKYLSPEIEAWSKGLNTKSLVRQGVSFSIFQDCNANDYRPVHIQQQMALIKSL